MKHNFYQEWIKNNLDELRKYAGEHVALNPEKGIVAHAPDQESFARQLNELKRSGEQRLIIFHASLYI